MSTLGVQVSRPFKIPTYSKEVKVLVVTCIDPRYIYWTTYFLNHLKELHNSYDLFCLAGASCGCYTGTYSLDGGVTTLSNSNWVSSLSQHINIAIVLHGIEEIWIIDHLDCGAFGAFNIPDTITGHTTSISTAIAALQTLFPQFVYKGFIMNFNGEITLIRENLPANVLQPYLVINNKTISSGTYPDHSMLPWLLFWIFLGITFVLLAQINIKKSI